MVTAEHMTPPAGELERALWELAGAVPDPELPVVSLAELGVLRTVHVVNPDRVEVGLTPTYVGCPALEAMAEDVRRALTGHGVREVVVHTVWAPAWTTDDITPEGRRKLAEHGIAPPRPGAGAHPGHPGRPGAGPVGVDLAVRCPHCGSTETVLLSRFSSTACKALRRCERCREPFDHFKEVRS
jgi:ring-1,2-phenylacetyl-CoA epoxidase subunit PaaD